MSVLTGGSRGMAVSRGVSIAAALAALSLAGCGGSGNHAATKASTTTPSAATSAAPSGSGAHAVSKSVYEAKMRRLGRRLSAAMRGMYPLVDTGVGTEENRQAAAKVEKARVVVTETTATLAALAPPADVRVDHQHLVAALGRLGSELDTLVRVLQHGGPKPFGNYTEFGALGQIARATSDMTRKGYTIN